MWNSRQFGIMPVYLTTKAPFFSPLFYPPHRTKIAPVLSVENPHFFVSVPRVVCCCFFFLPLSFHPWTITRLFMIYFESKIHLFWQMLVLGLRPKLSLIFWIVTQDLWFILCCQTNKIAHLAHSRIIISPQGDTMLNLFWFFRGEGEWKGGAIRDIEPSIKRQVCQSAVVRSQNAALWVMQSGPDCGLVWMV